MFGFQGGALRRKSFPSEGSSYTALTSRKYLAHTDCVRRRTSYIELLRGTTVNRTYGVHKNLYV